MYTQTVIDGPTYNDAQLLVQLYAMYQKGPIRKGFLWYLDHFKEDMDPSKVDYAALAARNPRISEGYDAWTAVASFFETVGVLVRNNVLNGGLVFERWPVEWYWRYLGPLVQGERLKGAVCDTACFADNFEWLAEQAKAWRSSDQAKAQWLTRLSREKQRSADKTPPKRKPTTKRR
ncbi:MAG: hypothetical protein AABN95_12910 [Acidobacteriota bacterium]